MNKMKKIAVLAALLTGWCASAAAQKEPGAMLVEGSFITHELGAGSLLLNPAALSALPGDDGVMLYDFRDEDGKRREFAFAMSMGSLGFAVQESPWMVDSEELTLHVYRINLAVGGRVLSIGTSNKFYQLEYPHHHSREFGIDAGLHFQPLPLLQIAALALDCNEPVLDGHIINRRYLLGTTIVLFGRALFLQQQVELNDASKYIEDLTLQSGIVVRPWGRLEVGVGYKKEPSLPERFLAQATLPLPIGFEIGAALRSDKEFKSRMFAVSLLLPLQTLRF